MTGILKWVRAKPARNVLRSKTHHFLRSRKHHIPKEYIMRRRRASFGICPRQIPISRRSSSDASWTKKIFSCLLTPFVSAEKDGVAFFSIFLYYIVSSLVKRSDESVALCCKTARRQQKAIAGRRRARACVLAGAVCRARQKKTPRTTASASSAYPASPKSTAGSSTGVGTVTKKHSPPVSFSGGE